MKTHSSICDVLLAKLDEVMTFLQFSKSPTADFRGVITFFFRSTENKDVIACTRTVDMRQDIVITKTPLPPHDPFSCTTVPVHVTLADFLFMYSGEATTSEIAGMCMSGRVSVPWTSYGQLKAFAECFDFSSEKWEEFYSCHPQQNTDGFCSKPCCQSTTKEEIDANWCLISDATTIPTSSGGEEWEIVSDCQCLILPKEKREQIEQVFGVAQINEWFRNLCQGRHNRSRSNTINT